LLQAALDYLLTALALIESLVCRCVLLSIAMNRPEKQPTMCSDDVCLLRDFQAYFSERNRAIEREINFLAEAVERRLCPINYKTICIIGIFEPASIWARLRLNFEARPSITPNFLVGLGLAASENGFPRSVLALRRVCVCVHCLLFVKLSRQFCTNWNTIKATFYMHRLQLLAMKMTLNDGAAHTRSEMLCL
jgi:hypothetical protein